MSDEPAERAGLWIPLDHLRDDQIELVRALLRAGDVPVAIIDGHLVTGPAWAEDVDAALDWVLAVRSPATDDDNETDPELRTGRGPLVPPSRPPLPDGRRQATRWRRLAGGMIDEVVLGVPLALAIRADAAVWLILAVHFVYYALPSASHGWTLGKLVLDTRLVDRRTLRTPSPLAVGVRWCVMAAPLAIALVLGSRYDLRVALALAVYLPIMWDLRGLHDRAAGTLVVERHVHAQ
jgi:uncharacterized RDD family membrane protein YckC